MMGNNTVVVYINNKSGIRSDLREDICNGQFAFDMWQRAAERQL